MNFIIITTNYNGLAEGMFADIVGMDNVKMIKPYIKEPSRVMRKAFSVCAANNYLHNIFLPLSKVQESKYQLSKVICADELNCIIFSDMTLHSFSEIYLKRLRSMPNVHLSVLFLNSTKVISLEKLKKKLAIFDKGDIYTFEDRDAREHGWNYVDSFYSTPKINISIKTHPGVFYIGQAGNRIDSIHAVYSKLTAGGINVDFNVVGCPNEKKLTGDNLNYIDGMNYFETIEHMCALDCILEVQSRGQVAPTLRYHQAISMNKKLLTNNLNVSKLPFYNPDFIKIFSKAEDIDINWLKTPLKVDYGYDGRYSPVKFLEQIRKRVKDEEKDNK